MDEAGQVTRPVPRGPVWMKTHLCRRITYKDPEGTTRTWESAERRTRPAASDIDGVGILAILEKEDGGPTRVLGSASSVPET